MGTLSAHEAARIIEILGEAIHLLDSMDTVEASICCGRMIVAREWLRNASCHAVAIQPPKEDAL